MAAAVDTLQNKVVLSGFIGGNYRSWKKIYFQISATTLVYCISEGDLESRGEIDLTEGRGARHKMCTSTNGLMEHSHTIGSFCLVIEGRTYYMYGTDTVELKKWRKILLKIISKEGYNPIVDKSEEKIQHEITKIFRSELTTK